ncbi:MAG: OmpA family protein [Paludibacteraceae bacterium]|nr:OmpA family protein [Paludibacteraceae bacterium]
MKKLIYLFCAGILASSCVTQAKYNEVVESEARLYEQAKECDKDLNKAKAKISDLEAQIAKLSQEKELIEEDTTRLSKELQRVVEDCNRMQEQNSNLLDKLKGAKSKEEIQKMLEEIQTLQSELIQREDALFKAERALKDKQAELEDRNAKITELTKLLEERDNYLNSLKDKVMKALAPFESEGLKVSEKGGKVYVSMDEKLLFQSGRWVVDAKGAKAIRELSNVLATTKDVDIVVEGHTDNVPFSGNGNIIDNWDLSVKRATSIVRILLENKDINPAKVSASGRSEYCPIETADTKEARKANRRIEIILTPNLDELLKIFE